MNYLHEYAQPFFLEGDDEGCLLIHGFTGSPAHMRLLGEVLHKQKYTVSGILLKGHGTCLEDMAKTDWKDWLNDTKEEYDRLCRKCSKVYVIGLSMGGILSLILAENYPVDKMVSIASPMHVYDKLLPFARVMKYFKRFNSWEKSEPMKGEAAEYDITYSGLPVNGAASLYNLMKMAEKHLSKITCSTFIIQSRMDRIVKPESAEIIFNSISSTHKELLWLEHSKHVCTIGPERQTIHDNIITFLKK
ncbi:alpha/beta fold hydrolase [Petroclostridium sp. X23]|uniref:alpha/beta hydrolase n=1 Tax=Petroclostridium sp. X23 TaxID=3045146 RepID=UPI0024AE3452|nr:alpha/beta fold hydrolase [Petroclostridium sp. X23]WHH57281.1 alpha/beta hydrolase [Petroclostridium sp. X23]